MRVNSNFMYIFIQRHLIENNYSVVLLFIVIIEYCNSYIVVIIDNIITFIVEIKITL